MSLRSLFIAAAALLLGAAAPANVPAQTTPAPTAQATKAVSNSAPAATAPTAPPTVEPNLTASNVGASPNGSSTAASNGIAWSINDSNTAPPMGQLHIPGTIIPPTGDSPEMLLKKYQAQLELGRDQRRQGATKLAVMSLSGIVTNDSPREIKRQALFELALVAQDAKEYVRAEQIFAQYQQTFPDDPSTPEVILREGLIYRQMGLTTLAVSKFYAVLYSALKLKLENMDYYKKLVLQAQVEIADTYYQEGRYDDAVDYLRRLIKDKDPNLDMAQTHYKLIRSLSYTTNDVDTVAHAQDFLNIYAGSPDIPEVRFLLAASLKRLGRNNDAMKQVRLLLQSQVANAKSNPEAWAYWQQKAGNQIADQLFKEGDYLDALQIYLNLAGLNKSPTWQLPVWYQTGLVYEQLQQWEKAGDIYGKILARREELGAAATPSMVSLLDMTKWRKDYIDWMQKAKVTQQSYALSHPTNLVSALRK